MRKKGEQMMAISVALSMFLMVGVIGVATAQPTADIVPSTQVVSPGGSFDVSVFMDTDGHKWISGRVEHLTFDGSVVETTTGDVVPGDLLVTPSVALRQVNNTAGTVRFDAGDIGWASQTPTGNYMTVTFTVKDTAAPGTYPLNLTWMRFMDENETVWVTPDIEVTNGTVTIGDNTPPTYSNITVSPASPATYATGQNYTFNITVQDNVAVDTVLFEFDGVNYTDFAHANSVFSYQLTDLAVGTYNYRWYMNDTSNNWNSTSSQSYIVTSSYPRWDINEDGVVDDVDLGYLLLHYNEDTESPYPRWDINEDGVVDDVDLGLLLLHYGEDYR